MKKAVKKVAKKANKKMIISETLSEKHTKLTKKEFTEMLDIFQNVANNKISGFIIVADCGKEDSKKTKVQGKIYGHKISKHMILKTTMGALNVGFMEALASLAD